MKLTRTNSLLVLVAVTAISLAAADALAQPGGGGGRGRPGGGFGGFGGGGNSVLDLAGRKDVREHLELLPDQEKDLDALAESERAGQRDRFRDLFAGLREGSEEERAAARERIQETMRKAAADVQKKVDNILLPHQSKRLSQLAMQRRLRGGVSGAFGNEDIASQIGITAAQREQLQAKARSEEEAMREKVAELRKAMQAKLLATLSPSQRAKYESLIGEPFEFAPDERRTGGFGQGRGGQPGGGGQPRGGRTRAQRPGQ